MIRKRGERASGTAGRTVFANNEQFRHSKKFGEFIGMTFCRTNPLHLVRGFSVKPMHLLVLGSQNRLNQARKSLQGVGLLFPVAVPVIDAFDALDRMA